MHDDLVGSIENNMNAKSNQGRMDFGHGKIRMNLEEDRLSSLPDDLIHKILTFTNLEEAIGTSVLSTRWRSIWKSMPNLALINFPKNDSPRDFSKFVYNVLSHRNDQVQLSSVHLYSDGKLITTEGFPSLEKVDIHMCSLRTEDVPKMICLLQQLRSVKLLTLNFEILRVLSSSMGLMSNRLSPFANFKIVKFSPMKLGRVYLEVGATTSLLDTSDQNAIFPLVSPVEIKVMSDIVLSQLLISRNRYLVRKRKRKAATITKHMEQVDAPTDGCKRKIHGHGKAQVKKQKVQSAFEKRWHFGEMMAQIKRSKREGLLEKFPTYDTRRMISLLQDIDGLLTELSASNGPAIQATFSMVCEEASVVTNNILDCMMIPFNKKRKRSQV